MWRQSRNKSTKIIYIFCEWTTEEKYFEKVKQLYRVSLKINIVDLEWWTKIKDHPEWIKRKIIETLRHDNPKIWWITPQVFIVFDIDIFVNNKDLDNTLSILKDYHLIPSNMTFEYWILSHFIKFDFWKCKGRYLTEIKKFETPSNDKFTWRVDFDWLDIDKINNAVSNVKSVNISTWHIKDRDPYSEVYKIIECVEWK